MNEDLQRTERLKRTKSATAVNNGDFICVETVSACRVDPKGKQHLLSPDVGDEELGKAVLDALAHSRYVLPQDDMELYDYHLMMELSAAWIKNLMALYGYKTKRALFKNMHNCHIARENDSIEISPSRHEKLDAWTGTGNKGKDYVAIPASSSPAEVGAALRLAFSRCK